MAERKFMGVSFEPWYAADGGGGGGYTQRELDILTGKVTDLSNEEIDWFDKHGCDVIPEDDGLRHSGTPIPEEPPAPPSFTNLSSTPPAPFVPPTFISESARALEEKEKD